MSFAQYKEFVEEGDKLIVYEGPSSRKPVVVEAGKMFNNRFGNFSHSEMIGKPYGYKMACARTKGWIYLLYPTSELWTLALMHRTQILYESDISMVIFNLDLKPGSVVCESGTGSGSLSHSLIRAVAPTGHVYSYEFHEDRANKAREEFKQHGLADLVTVTHADACDEGFQLEDKLDAVFLDLPMPHKAIDSAKRAIKREGGRLCSFSPCIEQVQRMCVDLASKGFVDIRSFECLYRPFEVRSISVKDANMSMPTTTNLAADLPAYNYNQIPPKPEEVETTFLTAKPVKAIAGHTGYLTFATLPHKEELDHLTTVEMEQQQ